MNHSISNSLSNAGAIKVTARDVDSIFHSRSGMLWIYAEWCGYCKNAMEEYVRLVHHANRYFPEFVIAIMDSDDSVNHAWLKNHNIRSFPTFMAKKSGGNLTIVLCNRNVEGFINAITQ